MRSHEASWKNDKHRAQWPSTLKAYVYLVIGKKPVDQVGIDDILAILKPIWTTKAPTAGNVRGGLDKILGWATALGYRTGDKPASRDGPLQHLLPSIGKLKREKKHHAAVPYKEVPAVVAELRKLGSTSATALVFTILTAARTGEALGATWDEIDLGAKLWTIPASRMKADAEHQVPLADEVITLLKSLPRDVANLHLFRDLRAKAASEMTAPPFMDFGHLSLRGHASRPTSITRLSRRLLPIRSRTRLSRLMPERRIWIGGESCCRTGRGIVRVR